MNRFAMRYPFNETDLGSHCFAMRASVQRNALGRGPLPVRRNGLGLALLCNACIRSAKRPWAWAPARPTERAWACIALQCVHPFSETPNPSDGTPNPCEAVRPTGCKGRSTKRPWARAPARPTEPNPGGGGLGMQWRSMKRRTRPCIP